MCSTFPSKPSRVRLFILRLLPVLLLLQTVLTHSATSVFSWDYIVVGAGPSGLQMAYFLQRSRRHYIVLEKAGVSGSFFETFPKHDRLISINKRHTGKRNKEFNLRHDWNSLLSDEPSLTFGRFSKAFFPDRRDMLSYLANYTTTLGLNVRYNTEVMNISRAVPESEGRGQGAVYRMLDQKGQAYSCRHLLIGTGMWKPNVQSGLAGFDLTTGYENLPIDPNYFEGKSVLILGNGNSAFETADAIYGVSSVVHIAGRSRVRLAWETHYVGDLRGVYNGILDTYQLKSLDGLLEGDLSELSLFPEGEKIKVNLSGVTFDNFALRESYDCVIRCLGFTFDDSPFSPDTRPQPATVSKFPLIDAGYRVMGHTNMYVIGAASHSLDFRKSAGGFIHGFRYTVRSLHHLLEWSNHGVTWPAKVVPVTSLLNTVLKRLNEASGLYQMFGVLVDIILFNRNGVEIRYIEEFPVQLLPRFQEVTGHPLYRCVLLTMHYGSQFSGSGRDVFHESRATAFAHEAHHSNFLHPVLYFYDKPFTDYTGSGKSVFTTWSLPKPRRLHHVVEDFLTSWMGPTSHILPLRRFLEYSVDHDLRNFFNTECFALSMTHRHIPLSCQQHIPLELY